jgi:NitT/TauT family transport system ATP-binding protein
MSAPAPKVANAADRPVAISIRNVTQRFGERGSPNEVLAVDNVSLDIRRGEFVCLLGPSGCGKSTLLNIVGGLFEATEGTVMVGDKEVRKPLPRDISFVFQESTLFPWYTIRENFDVSFKFQNVPKSEWGDRTREALAAVGMSKFIDHYPNQLSVGMRQRVNLTRGIALGTEILLMDEPFAALDEQTRMVLGEDLSSLLARTGKTIVFVTHSLAEAVFLADRIFVMTARPGRMKSVIEVSEPHPRSPDFMLTPKFSEWRNELYALLRDEVRQAIALERESETAHVAG